MIKTSVQKLAQEIGFDIANSDDEAQANLLNGLGEGLSNAMNENKLDVQLCYIVDKLNPKTISVLKSLNEFIALKENNATL